MTQGDNPPWPVSGGLLPDLQAPVGRYRCCCQQGEGENRIKERECALRADKTSYHRFATNQFGLLLHTVVYGL